MFKKLVSTALMLVAVNAFAADWYTRMPVPSSKTPTKEASITARAVGIHLTNIALKNAGSEFGVHPYSVADSTSYVKNFTKVCYGPSYATVTVKPISPFVCVYDRLTASQKTAANAL